MGKRRGEQIEKRSLRFFFSGGSFQNERSVLAFRRFGEFAEIRRTAPGSSGAGFHEAYTYIHDENIRQLKIIICTHTGESPRKERERQKSDVVEIRNTNTQF